MILISTQHNEDRLAGTLANLLRGSGSATIEIYDDSGDPIRPALITDPPTGVLLATFTLTSGIGVVAANKLNLELPPDALVMANGMARWARIKNKAGDASMDVDVAANTGSGEIKVEDPNVVAGSLLRIISALIG